MGSIAEPIPFLQKIKLLQSYGTMSYMWSAIDQNIVMQHMTVT